MKPHVRKKSTLSNVKVHFMGIGGSGMSAVAILAKEYGFKVEGSDLQETTPYLDKVKKKGIKAYVGHDTKQLRNVDILCVSPAVYFNTENPFVEFAKEMKIEILTWQAFMGKYLHKGKKVICIAGAHGKSTTTSLGGLVFEKSLKDPTVEVGATVPSWNANFRIGKSKFFLSEADEFFDNFLNYYPETVVITNVDYEHPDYFKTKKQYFDSFLGFIRNIKDFGNLIVNLDDKGTKDLLDKVPLSTKKNLNIVGYTIEDRKLFTAKKVFRASQISHTASGSFYHINISGKDETLFIGAAGEHNVYNSLAVYALSTLYKIKFDIVHEVFMNFTGIGRRLEFLGEKDGMKVFDDYAHHPTEMKASLSALSVRYPKAKILAIVEPHSYSRIKEFESKYKDVFWLAEKVLVTQIFKSRDTETFGVSEKTLCKAIGKNCSVIKDFGKVVDFARKDRKKYDIVLVMGAGKSYQLAKDILNNI